MRKLEKLYEHPLASSRAGAFYNAFAYPTKISPEAIAIYIACATEPGDTVLDVFAGSGSTGIAALLCEHPTQQMKITAASLGVTPKWGARNAVLYEIGTYASFATSTLLNRLTASEYEETVDAFFKRASELLGNVYTVKDPENHNGTLRYAIWSELLTCPFCGKELSYFDCAMSRNPAAFNKFIECPHCGKIHNVEEMPFAVEDYQDPLLGRTISRKKRVPAWIYGTTNGVNWDRPARPEDADIRLCKNLLSAHIEPKEIRWGELHRSGYHYGITHLHHFYTQRNFLVMTSLWQLAESFPKRQADALKLLLLSYNATHCTMMTRVVAKKNMRDFVLTGAQSGVLYISKAPVEKNIMLGLQRKAKSFAEAYAILENCNGTVTIHNQSSTNIVEPDKSIDFVFTDPPFGDFIPYAEVNQINELWLEKVTDRTDEIIISDSQKKDITTYQKMLTDVFKEVNRTLKPTGYASVVFHAAKATVWEAFNGAINDSGFYIKLSNILDKTQASFKQVVSEGSVRGDPLFLLQKTASKRDVHSSDTALLDKIIEKNFSNTSFDMRRCYSMYAYTCLEHGISVTMDAKQVYNYFNLKKVCTHEKKERIR